jgi:hypothetical protein
MNELVRRKPATEGIKSVALFSALLFVGIAVYTSRTVSPIPAAASAGAEQGQNPTAPTPHAVVAAAAFLDALDARQREKALYEFGSAKKSNWSNLPVTIVPRNGVRLGDLTKDQRARAMAVLAAALSERGYQKVVDIMAGDQKLAETDVRGGRGRGSGRGPEAMFGADQYYLALFGKPSATEPWMVQFGGHHLGINVTVIGKHFVLTPTHTGAQPALFTRDGKEVRPLGLENDTAFKLVNALDEQQRRQAIIGARPQQLLLGPGRDGRKIEPQGIKGSALAEVQQTMLLDLIAVWENIVEPTSAEARMREIRTSIDDTYFAWKGPTVEGSAAYFRVQGPSVVIEYAPQLGTDHIHTVVRNPKDDYGAGLLER